MHNLFIIHFQPIEKYPPVINLLRYLSIKKDQNTRIYVITSTEEGRRQIDISGVFIQRCICWKKNLGRWARLQLYIKFNTSVFRELGRYMPQKLMYFETLSAGAPFIYKKWVNRKSEIFIHYHEYTSNQEYKKGMLIQYFLHKLELKLYQSTTWVSHTNDDRLQLFLKDIGTRKPLHTYILPNYPPAAWKGLVAKNKKERTGRIGFVYTGALGLKTMYIQKFSNFIKNNEEQCYWHIYSDNYAPEVIDYFEMLGARNIEFKGAVDYDDLPSILGNYDVGVILYNGHIPNYVYNAPNKLFEYLVCGLDVWFPTVMKGCNAYITANTYPEVKSVDFINLDHSLLQIYRDRQEYQWSDFEYYCETIFPDLTKQLLTHAGYPVS